MQSRYFSNRSGYDLRHLIEQDLLARASDAEVQAKVFLLHAINVRNLGAPVKQIGAEF